jgi:hypothetical protein
MYDVASVDTDTQVTLSAPYAGTTASGVVYAIGTGFTVPDSFPEMSQGDIETATIFTRAMRGIQSKFTALVSDISGKADQATTYTETEVDSLLDDKAAISGQTFTGDIAAPKITASTGILFGTDTAAANTLDDYGEGSWTPSVVSQSNMTGATIGAGSYTKIGNLVFAELKGSFSVTSGASARTLLAFSLPILQSTTTTVVGGGGIIQAPSNLNINPGVGDLTVTNATDSFMSFTSFETGNHTFSISITYREA